MEQLTQPGLQMLDTSVVIALFHENRIIDLSLFDELIISSITYAELMLGVANAKTAEIAMQRYATVERVKNIFGKGVPFDDAAADEYGAILRTVVSRKGSARAHANDRMIAATAVSRGAGLITLNGADLRGLEKHLAIVEL